MSWITLSISDSKVLLPVLERIASALERIAPLPENEVPEIKPEDAVSYADEGKIEREEQIEALGHDAERIAQFLRENPEWDDVQPKRS